MTDPFDFELRLEERLVAHAARAIRPFDAAAIAVAATLRPTSPRLARPLTPSRGRVSVLRVATILLLLVTLLAATLLAGGFPRRPPTQILPAVVGPSPSPALLSDPTTGPTPTGTPEASHQPRPPRADRLAVVTYDARGCGGRLIEIDVATSKQSNPLDGCFDVVGVQGGGRFVVAGGGTRVQTGDGYSISGDQSGATVMNLVTGDTVHVANLQATAQLAPGGQWALEYGPMASPRRSDPRFPLGRDADPCRHRHTEWARAVILVPGWAPLAVRTDLGLAVWDGGSTAFHLVDSIQGSVWSWSADGQTVSSIWGQRVYVADIEGTTVVDVTAFPGAVLAVSGSHPMASRSSSGRTGACGSEGRRRSRHDPAGEERDGRLDVPGRADAGTD